MTPPSKLDASSRAVSATSGRARQISAPIDDAPEKDPAKKASAGTATLKSVDVAAADEASSAEVDAPRTARPRKAAGPAKKAAAADRTRCRSRGDRSALEEVPLEELVADVAADIEVVPTDVVLNLETEEVVLTVGKKRDAGRRRRVDLRAGRGGQARG